MLSTDSQLTKAKVRQRGDLFEVVHNGRVVHRCGLISTAMTKVRHMERERCVCGAPGPGLCVVCREAFNDAQRPEPVSQLEEEMNRRRQEELELENVK